MDSEKRAERTDRKQGGFRRVFKFRYDDIALFLGMSKAACRKAAQRGKFDPGDLGSIFAFKVRRGASETEVQQVDVLGARKQADVLSKRLRNVLDGVEKLKLTLGPGDVAGSEAETNGATVHELPTAKPVHGLDAVV